MNKRFEIQKYLSGVEQATLAEIYEAVPFGYYHNGHKHLGQILSKMVESGQVERISKGVFRLGTKVRLVKGQKFYENKNQKSLF